MQESQLEEMIRNDVHQWMMVWGSLPSRIKYMFQYIECRWCFLLSL
jgi:hypothetical protein